MSPSQRTTPIFRQRLAIGLVRSGSARIVKALAPQRRGLRAETGAADAFEMRVPPQRRLRPGG